MIAGIVFGVILTSVGVSLLANFGGFRDGAADLMRASSRWQGVQTSRGANVGLAIAFGVILSVGGLGILVATIVAIS